MYEFVVSFEGFSDRQGYESAVRPQEYLVWVTHNNGLSWGRYTWEV